MNEMNLFMLIWICIHYTQLFILILETACKHIKNGGCYDRGLLIGVWWNDATSR